MFDTFKDTYKTLFSKEVLLIWIAAVVVATVAGPFGTFSTMSLGIRALYWGSITTVSIFLGYTGHAFGRIMVSPDHFRAQNLVGAAIASVLMTVTIHVASVWSGLNPDGLDPPFHLLFSYTMLVCMFIGLIRIIFVQRASLDAPSDTSDPATSTAGTPERVHRLLRRLPDGSGDTIIHLSVDDHFVEVVTELGKVKLRMRMRDAIDELHGALGFRIHRSHWVAKDAIDTVVQGQGKVVVHLNTGAKVPVSRNYRSVLEDAGLL